MWCRAVFSLMCIHMYVCTYVCIPIAPHCCVQVRIMFEVQDLRFATPATVSRCGMIWFSEDVLSVEMIFENFLTRMRHTAIDDSEDLRFGRPTGAAAASKEDTLSPEMQVGCCSHSPLSCCWTLHLPLCPSPPPSYLLGSKGLC